MGGFTPTIAMAALQTGLQLAQANSQARAQNVANAAAAGLQMQQAQRQQAIRERERRERLRQALAGRRAQFAAQGLGGGGSADAVLEGLAAETERAIRDDRDLLSLSLASLNGQLEERRRRSLLELSDYRRRAAFGALQRGLGGHASLLEA
jgi:hypothetical protein